MTSSIPVYFLLVDDLEENLLSLDALLRRDGLVLLKAHSGTEALELLLKYDVALALMDVQMPGMDGFELAELMRGNERTGNVPIIFLTAGAADRKRRFQGYEAGAVDFINKPIEADILRGKTDVFFQLKRQQNLLAQQRDELRIVAEENARLLTESRQYADALKQADQRKDEFLATLAHELRNPLAPIRNGLQIMRMSPGDDKAADLRDMMDRQLTHLVRLIDDLLDVSRISRGKIELRKENILLQEALKAGIEASRPLIEENAHELTVNIDTQELWVDADPTRVAQIISNLLNNAAKYTPRSGKISLKVEQKDERAVISVSDNGIGMTKDMIPKIFALFTQVDSDSIKSQGGLGIGLSLVRNLVEMHAGTVEAQSNGLGEGSTFIVTLPSIAAAQTNDQDDQISIDRPETMTILVVDDNVASAQTLGWMLELSNHTIVLAHSGLEGLQKAREIQPDAILLDIGLPDVNGYDVCREIRKDPRLSNTLLIAQTGWGQKRDMEIAYEAGFDYHLVKPISLDNLNEIFGANGIRKMQEKKLAR